MKGDRELKYHIGFQEGVGLKRKNTFLENYKDNQQYQDDEDNDIPHIFNTHYSNIFYTSNYLIRYFPYSFIGIELQGDGFDDPNRLFYSILIAFYNSITQKSDLRELIPEFFYLPEMFMNMNSINFHENAEKVLVDDVIIPDDFEKNKSIKDVENFFLFIGNMKDKLEKSPKDNLNKWMNLIFGNQQKFLNKNELLFRNTSYLDVDDNIFEEYMKNENIMNSVEFGLTPFHTITKNDILSSVKNNKQINKENKKKNEDEFVFKKNFEGINGKLSIFRNGVLFGEHFDHSEKINCLGFNERLNIYATSSYDGLICVYTFPNKLICVIKNKKINSYFHKVYPSANPFPSIIAYDKGNEILYSYTLSGILINTFEIKNKSKIEVSTNFNISGGGSYFDELKITFGHSESKTYIVPFFYKKHESK